MSGLSPVGPIGLSRNYRGHAAEVKFHFPRDYAHSQGGPHPGCGPPERFYVFLFIYRRYFAVCLRLRFASRGIPAASRSIVAGSGVGVG